MPPPLSTTDRALMQLPYEQWLSLSAAAQHAGIDENAATSLARTGRRRGVLRSRGKGTAQQVMRIHPGPRRPSRRTMGSRQ
ncbi:hypothetical protein [Streptomyces cavernicola]|uniref:DNA-binding protein n=1 Tax=Streptomyces cavernicola TaxID=3043613 RepID=A0ABT6SIJ8_9ACTN|nr:hypothetical protein [Streptomyces sp. B-S-A6]MDI3407709.1 hypothetical protein [Streptomyces sp. B-S-A6]